MPERDSVEHFLEHLAHEMSHLALNAIMVHDPLIENPMDKHSAPLRADERPLYQVLHATFVLSRNVRVSRKIVDKHPKLGYAAGLKTFEEQYAEGYRTIQKEARFTDAGRQLFESMESLRA